MPKRTSSYLLTLPLRRAGTPANRWLYWALRTEILEGRMRPGARLPGTRDLALQYGLSRGTIVDAFDQLKSEGYVQGSVGSGTYVSSVLPDDLFRPSAEPRSYAPERRTPRRNFSAFGRRVAPFPVLESRPSRAFRPNVPALDLFPAALWTQVASRRLRRASTGLFLGCDPMGYRPLRMAVAGYLGISRGVKCDPDQVAILSGVQEAIDIVTRLFLDPGDRVCMENPGYTGAALAFRAAGAVISTAPVDGEGMQVRPALLKGSRLVYITPAHQFPLGMAMSLRRRLELLDRARSAGALIFEDDYDSEFRYSGRPIPALQGLDRAGVVLFAGTFSKVMFPSLRLGYLVVPADIVPYVESTLSISSRHAPLIEQAVLSDFIAEGHFGRHLRRMREIYSSRLSVLRRAAEKELNGLLEISGVEAGLQTAGWLAEGIDAGAAASAAAARNVEVVPLNRYTRGRAAREGLQIGFAAVDENEIRRGVRELAVVLEAELRTRAR